MAKKDKRNEIEDLEETEEMEEAGIPVVAEEPCFYANVYRNEGDKFSVESENQLSRVMRRLDGKPHPKDAVGKKKEEKAVGVMGPEPKELKQPETIKDATDHLI